MSNLERSGNEISSCCMDEMPVYLKRVALTLRKTKTSEYKLSAQLAEGYASKIATSSHLDMSMTPSTIET